MTQNNTVKIILSQNEVAIKRSEGTGLTESCGREATLGGGLIASDRDTEENKKSLRKFIILCWGRIALQSTISIDITTKKHQTITDDG